MRISPGGAARGVIGAVLTVFFLVYLPNLLSGFLSNSGINVSGTLSSVFLTRYVVILAIALAVLGIPGSAIKDAPRITGTVKILQGIVLAAYYYLVLSGGVVSISVLYTDFQLDLVATVFIALALLELSAAMKVLQGVFEFRERPAPVTPPMMAPTAPPMQAPA